MSLAIAALAIARSLDGEPGRVEERHVARAPATVGVTGEHLPELGHVVAAHGPGRDRSGQLAAVARLLAARSEVPSVKREHSRTTDASVA